MSAVVVRTATPGDAAAIARVHIESSQDSYAPLARAWRTLDLAERTRVWARKLVESEADPRCFELVATIDGEVVGFAGAGPARRDDVDAELELYVIHVLPAHRGRGVGALLWKSACDRLRGPDLRAMYLETFAELRCCSFYDARGGEVVQRRARDYHGGPVTELVYRWPAGTPSTVDSP